MMLAWCVVGGDWRSHVNAIAAIARASRFSPTVEQREAPAPDNPPPRARVPRGVSSKRTLTLARLPFRKASINDGALRAGRDVAQHSAEFRHLSTNNSHRNEPPPPPPPPSRRHLGLLADPLVLAPPARPPAYSAKRQHATAPRLRRWPTTPTSTLSCCVASVPRRAPTRSRPSAVALAPSTTAAPSVFPLAPTTLPQQATHRDAT